MNKTNAVHRSASVRVLWPCAVLFAIGTAIIAGAQTGGGANPTPQEIARASQAAYAALTSYSDSGTVVSELNDQGAATTTFKIRLQRTNLYRIDWTQTRGLTSSKGSVWSDGTGDHLEMGGAGQLPAAKPQKVKDMETALASATGISSSAAATIPGTFFKQNWGDALGAAASGHLELKMADSEKIGGTDCYVFSSSLDPAKLPNRGSLPAGLRNSGTNTTTLWIGKEDHLIHQTRTVTEGMSTTPPQPSDAELKTALEAQNQPATPAAIAAMRAMMEAAVKQCRV